MWKLTIKWSGEPTIEHYVSYEDTIERVENEIEYCIYNYNLADDIELECIYEIIGKYFVERHVLIPNITPKYFFLRSSYELYGRSVVLHDIYHCTKLKDFIKFECEEVV